MAKTVSSRKQKGRVLQQWVRDKILELFQSLEPDDVKSTSSGASGEDVQLSPAARKLFPYGVECKNTERVSFWNYWKQCVSNSGKHYPLLVIKRNRQEPLVVITAEHFFNLIKEIDNGRQQKETTR